MPIVIRLLARWSLLISLAFVAALLLMRARSYDESVLTGFFAGCTPMPCWQGIRPGETTTDEALTILNAHPWVQDVSEVNAVSFQRTLINWTWSKRYPFTVNLPFSEQGLIIFRSGIVEQIYLTSSLLLGDVWLTLGTPTGGTMDYIYSAQHFRVDNTSLFAEEGLAATARTAADCTTAFTDYWRSPVYFWLQARETAQFDLVDYSMYLKVMRTGYHQIRASIC